MGPQNPPGNAGAGPKVTLKIERPFMLPKYTIEYRTQFKKHAQTNHYSSDDPVACEEFVEELLDRGFRIQAIKHEGLDLPKNDFDKMIKTAAGMLASKRICAALGIKPDEEHFRFGFVA
jgi:hypothetical protein